MRPYSCISFRSYVILTLKCQIQSAQFYFSISTDICSTSFIPFLWLTDETHVPTKKELWSSTKPSPYQPLSSAILLRSSDCSCLQSTNIAQLSFEVFNTENVGTNYSTPDTQYALPLQPTLKNNPSLSF